MMRALISQGSLKVAITYSPAFAQNISTDIGVIRFIHKKGPAFAEPSEGGDYLLSRFRSTIGVIRFNFSVR
ncbi:MAG: hypothetical protein K2M93_03390, partial [Muribaculaceae bacterium]|nr:hypothetical protein [Muribaculaceae bacterium]